MNTTSEDRVFGGVVAILVIAGFACLGVGNVHDIFWLRAVGIALLALAGFLAALTLLLPTVIFFAWLDWIGFLPIGRVVGWVRQQAQRAEELAEMRAGAAPLIEDQYRLFVTRKAPVAKPTDLHRAVTRLVWKLRRIGGRAFTLYGYNPAMRKRRVLPFGLSRVWYFLERSEIAWNFGREPSDPTHQLTFFSRFNGTHAVYLRIRFITDAAGATCPGLCAELRLAPAVAGRDEKDRAERVERLFRLLVETLTADSGHVELPGRPESEAVEVSGVSEVECA